LAKIGLASLYQKTPMITLKRHILQPEDAPRFDIFIIKAGYRISAQLLCEIASTNGLLTSSSFN
jgi:hypothetical protein